jgi:hypothetical protein
MGLKGLLQVYFFFTENAIYTNSQLLFRSDQKYTEARFQSSGYFDSQVNC